MQEEAPHAGSLPAPVRAEPAEELPDTGPPEDPPEEEAELAHHAQLCEGPIPATLDLAGFAGLSAEHQGSIVRNFHRYLTDAKAKFDDPTELKQDLR